MIFLTHSRWGPHRDAFKNRLGMSGLLEHVPGKGIAGRHMEWAPGLAGAEIDLSSDEQERYVAFAPSDGQAGAVEFLSEGRSLGSAERIAGEGRGSR